MIRPVQTNIALYRQMHMAGYSIDDIRGAQRAYALALVLFAGAYRGSGKPFVCHLVGSASVIVHLKGEPDVILASLSHAFLEHAVYPDGGLGWSTDRIPLIQSYVGASAAELVRRYNDAAMDVDLVASALAAPEPPSGSERDILVMRIANFIDELTDGGLAFASTYSDRTTQEAADYANLARKLGEPELAGTIVELLPENDLVQSLKIATEAEPRYTYRLIPRLRPYFRLRRKMVKSRAEILSA